MRSIHLEVKNGSLLCVYGKLMPFNFFLLNIIDETLQLNCVSIANQPTIPAQ